MFLYGGGATSEQGGGLQGGRAPLFSKILDFSV